MIVPHDSPVGTCDAAAALVLHLAGGQGCGRLPHRPCCTGAVLSSMHPLCSLPLCSEAAKAYLRHNGVQRLPNCPPLCLAFSDRLPPCSAKAGDAGRQPSVYVWATRDAVGDAESITDELRAAGLQLSHVHRWALGGCRAWRCGAFFPRWVLGCFAWWLVPRKVTLLVIYD